MSEQQSTVLNGPSGEVTMAFKDAPPPQESKPFSNTQQPYPPGEYYQRPPLARIDSRSSLQPRPNYPNQPRPPLPPGQQQYIPRNPAALPPRPPYVPQRPNQPQQQYRPATPYPRQQFQQAQRPQIFQQRSVPNPLQPRPPFSGEQTLRSQTLDHSELGRNDEQPEGGNYRPPMTSGLNRSLSLSSGTPEVNVEERRRTASAVDGSGDAPEEFSRPESRGGVRMNRISEDDDVFEPSKVGMQKKEGDGKQQGFGGIQEGNVEVKKALVKENETVEIAQKMEVKKSLIKENETVEIPQKMEVPRTPTPVKREDIKVPESPKIIETPRSPIPTKKIEPEIISQKSDEIKKSSDNEKNPLPKDRATPDMSLPLKPKTTFKTEGDNDSGVDESTQGNEQSVNGERSSPRKPVGKLPVSRTSSTTPTKSRSASRGPKSPNPKTPDSINSDTSATSEKKKVPMNKVQVGSAPSPNLKVVKSKIGSLQNANYKPGGGNVKIENRKIEIRATPRIAAKNEAYVPGGGDKKIQQQKLVWNAKSKIGSLENATHKPKGGDKKIETVKLDFKEKAKPKVGSKDNIKHVPGGGDVKSEEEDEHNIENQKLDLKVQSKVGSLDNVKHKPGGGDKKIFDDKDYLRQKSALSNDNNSLTGSQNSLPSHADAREPASDENLNRQK